METKKFGSFYNDFKKLHDDWKKILSDSARHYWEHKNYNAFYDTIQKKIVTAIYIVLKKHKIKNLKKYIREINDEFIKLLKTFEKDLEEELNKQGEKK